MTRLASRHDVDLIIYYSMNDPLLNNKTFKQIRFPFSCNLSSIIFSRTYNVSPNHKESYKDSMSLLTNINTWVRDTMQQKGQPLRAVFSGTTYGVYEYNGLPTPIYTVVSFLSEDDLIVCKLRWGL